MRERHGISLWRQFRQAAGLCFGAPQLDPWEHCFFEAFRDSFSPAEKRLFVGRRRASALDRAANAAAAREPADDRRLFHDLMRQHGLPHARIGAVLARDGRGALGAESLHDATGVARYRRNPENFPLFVKPASGARGRNIVALRAWLESGDRVMTTTGQPIALTQHPDTGGPFAGLRLPDWEGIRQLCLDGARLLPGLRLQHWDIAVTNRGPVAIECNVAGGMRTHQLVRRRGIYAAPLQAISGA